MNRLRPLAMGELLDRSVTFWRAHWKPLFWLMVGFQLVELIALKLMQVGLKQWFPAITGPDALNLARKAPEQLLPQALGAAGLMLAIGFFILFVSEISGVAASHYGWQRVIGAGAPSAGDAFRHAAQRLWPTLGAFTLSIAWSAVMLVVFLIPSVALGGAAAWFLTHDQPSPATLFLVLAAIAFVLGTIVLVLWFIMRFVLLGQILAIEDVGAWRAFRRADALSSGRVLAGVMGLVKVRLTVLITVMGGVLLLMSTVATIPTLVVGMIYGAGFTPGHTLDDVVPALVLVPLEIVQTILGSVVAPLYIAFQLFFYADMRMRREGLDLELSLGGKPS
ncbi:MAG: hypothetical protein ACO1OB_23255 [Archangium sp.]